MLRVEVVTHQGIVQVLDPVYLHGVRDVAYIIEEHVLVRFDYAYVLRVVQVLRDPLGTDEGVRVRITFLLYLLLCHEFSSLRLLHTSAHSSVSPIKFTESMFECGALYAGEARPDQVPPQQSRFRNFCRAYGSEALCPAPSVPIDDEFVERSARPALRGSPSAYPSVSSACGTRLGSRPSASTTLSGQKRGTHPARVEARVVGRE